MEPLTGMNYKNWKQDLEIVLGVMDVDVALRPDELSMPAERSISDVVHDGFLEATNAKEFLKLIEEKYKEFDETEIDNLMNSLTTMRYDGIESVHEYILNLIDIAGKLMALGYLYLKPF
ncbi:uncharacterized protein LOC126633857 [Malus sylvestris]|uniref:uncharacterized protein LOC126633857 n=1 Tax=Malus sylvestris TaxID=3752 RepID=UPI0021ACE399|nr:uncharacterized protein LOC126633857 [Malus sylvestris]